MMTPNLTQPCVSCIVLCFACLVNLASPNGQFYVGFLGYANIQNLNYRGECCDGQKTDSGCLDFCDLVFEVSVTGIDSDPASGKRPSEIPIDNDNAILFPTSYEGVINPMTFDFRKWTGHVNITVDVYDIDEKLAEDGTPELVDSFLFSFNHEGPSLDFIYMVQNGQRPKDPSELRMVFRYSCDPSYYGQNCSIDCLVHPNNKECPDTSGVTDWMLLATTPRGTTEKQCGFTRKPQSSEGGNDSGSQSKLCGNNTTLASEGTTTEAKQVTTTQRVVNATTDIVNVPNSITIPSSPSSHIISTGSQTRHMSFTTSNIMPQYSPTTPLSTEKTVSVVISKSSTTTGETGLSSIKVASPALNTQHTTDITTQKILHTEMSSLLPKLDSSTTMNVGLVSQPPLYNTNEVVSSTESQTLNPLSSIETSTSNRQDTSSALAGYTSTTSDIQSSARQQTGIIGDGTSSNDGAAIRHVTLSILSSMTLRTTPDAGSNPTGSDDDDVMDYWPAIVGGVLGALVLVAIVVFIFYYRKQKALIKRQDIYNVNPKRWALQPPLENGTTEKSDVALETEQV